MRGGHEEALDDRLSVRSTPAKRVSQKADLMPVNHIHQQAAAAVEKLLRAGVTGKGGCTIKGLTLAPHVRAKAATYAVTVEAVKFLPVLLQALLKEKVAVRRLNLRPGVIYVLGYEMLAGKGIQPRGRAELAMIRIKDALQTAVNRVIAAQDSQESAPQGCQNHGRFRSVRVNLIKKSVQEAVSWLVAPPAEHASLALPLTDVQIDNMLPDVLLLPKATRMHDHPLVKNGTLVLQSWSSCLPAHALGVRDNWKVLDCCAAPGNKTTHVASILRGRSTVVAFDKNAARVETLKQNTERAGARNVIAYVQDFLAVDVVGDSRLQDVQGVILDPSCSGSGTSASRLDYLTADSIEMHKRLFEIKSVKVDESQRLRKLAGFQKAALNHALQIPSVRRLVYSTCSTHVEENEEVVAAVIARAEKLGFCLVDPFPSWHRRGLPGVLEGSHLLVRVDEQQDGSDGFFLACFERASASKATASTITSSVSPKQKPFLDLKLASSGTADKSVRKMSHVAQHSREGHHARLSAALQAAHRKKKSRHAL
ncbi:unnamed protein product [Pedinophyceae sp. YPF-701]|nr:unnamed protein product [Pedinophyceae sp. YPF-701]